MAFGVQPQTTEKPSVPTGMELMLKSVLKMIGIKPEHILEPLTQIRDIGMNAEARLTRIENELGELRALIEKRSNSNEPDREHGRPE